MSLPKPPGKQLTRSEERLQELNQWIMWLEEWVSSPPGFKANGPMEETVGIRRLRNFLRELAYDLPGLK